MRCGARQDRRERGDLGARRTFVLGSAPCRDHRALTDDHELTWLEPPPLAVVAFLRGQRRRGEDEALAASDPAAREIDREIVVAERELAVRRADLTHVDAAALCTVGIDDEVASVRERGHIPVDDNEADALALLHWAVETQEV